MSKEYVLEILRTEYPEVPTASHYYGVALQEFDKDDLIRIVNLIGKQQQIEHQETAKTLDKVGQLLRSKK